MNNENAVAARIRGQYEEREQTKLDKLVEMDKKVKAPAQSFAYAFGTVGALVLGTGMSLAMKVIGAGLAFAMPLGIGVGLVGMFMVGSNYFLYQKMLKKRKAKYGQEIVALSNEILEN